MKSPAFRHSPPVGSGFSILHTMKHLIIILAFIPTSVTYAQSVTMSPLSMKGWGTTPDMAQVAVQYEGFGVHYFHNWNEHIYNYEGITQPSFAVSYSPIRLKHFEFGGMFSFNKLPVTTATNLNFILSAVLPIDNFDILYTHISNGFELLHDTNPGMDFISVRINL